VLESPMVLGFEGETSLAHSWARVAGEERQLAEGLAHNGGYWADSSQDLWTASLARETHSTAPSVACPHPPPASP
jgi:hypothetical protein